MRVNLHSKIELDMENDKDVLNVKDILNFKEYLANEEKKLPKTKNDFLSFVHELSKDFYDNSDSWENVDIRNYLEALSAWVDSMEGYYKNFKLPVPENPNWQLIAEMLVAAKVYDESNINFEERKKIKEITTKQDFVAFANELSESFYDNLESWKIKILEHT